MSTPTLYWFPGTCARVALVALEEIGLPFDAQTVGRFPPDAAFKAINAKGRVPALVVGSDVITENPAIATFLASRHPAARLLPVGDHRLEIEALSTMCWFASGIHPSISRFRFPDSVSDEPASHTRIRELARGQLMEAFAILELRLTGRDWLFDEWSIVDAYMLWLWFRATGSGLDGTVYPRCYEHAMRTEARPSVARALDREERELTRLMADGSVPGWVPKYQAGRAPVLE